MATTTRWGPGTRIGLVLGAGGLSGEAFHRGVLRGLHEGAGWDARTAELIVGTSAGSLVGASLRAAEHSAARGVPAAAAMAWLRPPGPGSFTYLAGALRRPWTVRPTALLSSLLPPGSRSTEVIQSGVRRRFGDEWPESPLWVVATRRFDGQRVVFGRDGAPGTDVASAVGASCAVPSYFQPVCIDGHAYVDGGLGSPTNADVLIGIPLDVVIVSSPMSIATTSVRPRADLSLRLMWHARLRRELRGLRASGVHVLTFEPDAAVLSRLRLHPMQVRDIDEVEDRAREMTLRQLDRFGAPTGRQGHQAA